MSDNTDLEYNRVLDNGTIKVTITGKFPILGTTVTYNDQEIYHYYNDIHDCLFVNNFKKLSLSEMKKYHNKFSEDLNSFLTYIKNSPEGEIFCAKASLTNIKKDIIKIINERQNNGKENKLLDELVNKGQLKYENGKYIFLTSPIDFIKWCYNNEYLSDKKGTDVLTAQFIYDNIQTNCALATIKKYISKFRPLK